MTHVAGGSGRSKNAPYELPGEAGFLIVATQPAMPQAGDRISKQAQRRRVHTHAPITQAPADDRAQLTSQGIIGVRPWTSRHVSRRHRPQENDRISGVSVQGVSTRARGGLLPRRGSQRPALAASLSVAFLPPPTAPATDTLFLSRLNTGPRVPLSTLQRALAGATSHDSGSSWVANLRMFDSFIHYTAGIRAHRRGLRW